MSDLVPLDDPVLHQPALPIAEEDFGTSDLEGAADRLNESFDVYFKACKGVGLAAPQIGIPWKLAVAEDYGTRPMSPRWQRDLVRTPFSRVIMCNPRIVWAGEGSLVAWETCLSEPSVFGLVERSSEIRVEYRNIMGVAHSLVVEHWAARVFSHEIDHLRGCLCSQRYLLGSSLTRDEYERDWKERPLGEALQAFRDNGCATTGLAAI